MTNVTEDRRDELLMFVTTSTAELLKKGIALWDEHFTFEMNDDTNESTFETRKPRTVFLRGFTKISGDIWEKDWDGENLSSISHYWGSSLTFNDVDD